MYYVTTYDSIVKLKMDASLGSQSPSTSSLSSSSVASMVISPFSSTSVVWKHFGFAKDDSGKLLKDSRAICKLCSQKVANGGGTFKNHLRMKHHPATASPLPATRPKFTGCYCSAS